MDGWFVFFWSFVCLVVGWLVFFRRRKPGTLPPGSMGLPLVGETLQLISAYKTDDPEPFIDERVRRYGPVFLTHLFGEPTVFVTDPDANRLVLQNEGKLFEISYPSSLSTLLGRHSLLLMKGALHKKMYSLTMSFANSAIIREHLLPDIDRLIRCNLASWPEGRMVRLLDETKKITFELSMKQLMSIDPGEWTENLMKEYLLLIDGFFSLPISLFFTTYGRALKARKKVSDTLMSMVKQRLKDREMNGEDKKDMLAALMENDQGFSEEEMVDFLLALLVAGYETTSTIMTLAVKFLSENPLALSQLKVEHERIREEKRKTMEENQEMALDWSDYKSMPFTQCVINETLRMANIISGIFRRSTEDVSIYGDYVIPKGWRVFTSFRAIHLDPAHYPNARTFDPWRWQQKPGAANIYTPFGGGPRLCPGYELARVELSVFLHHFVTNFSWEAAEEDKIVYFPTTRMAKRYPINVHRRKPLEVNQEMTQ